VLPNILTILRLLSVPVVLSLAYGQSPGVLALGLGLFMLTSFTDWLDGYLARTRKATTIFGTVMDPVADKILILGMLFVFSDIKLLPMWLVLINLFRELLISGIRAVQASKGSIIPANWMGKLKFCLQVVVVGVGFVQRLLESAGMDFDGGRHILFYCALFMTTVSVVLALNFLRWHGEGLMKERT